MANLGAILEAAGSGLDKLVKTTVFLMDLGDFAAMNDVYAKHVGDRPPARSTVQISGLPSGALVEIEAIAARLRGGRDAGTARARDNARMRPSRSSRRTGTPTSTRSERCSLRACSIRTPSSRSGR